MLLMDAGGETHVHEDVKTACFSEQILVWHGEPDTTSEWQPVDAGLAKTMKDLAIGDETGLEKWLQTSKINRKMWTRSRIGAKLRRRLSMRLLGVSWDAIHAALFEIARVLLGAHRGFDNSRWYR